MDLQKSRRFFPAVRSSDHALYARSRPDNAYLDQLDSSLELEDHPFSKQSAVLEIASASDEVDDASLKSVKAMRAELREAFSFNAYSLWATMAGQRWPDGDKHFYSRLEMPTLLICGCQDRLVSEEEEEETLFVLHCGRLRRLPEAGHMGMLEDPNKVNAYILEHINQPPSPRRLSKRVILQSTSSLSSETITTQPIPPKLIGFESQTYNAKCFEQVNSNCKITEGVDPLGLFNLFRPRIHSKRWRESEKFIQIGGNSSYYD